MEIIQTKIPDIDNNIDFKKIQLANKIVEMYSIFCNKNVQKKLSEIKDTKEDIEEKKKVLNNDKNILRKILNDLESEKKLNNILSRLERINIPLNDSYKEFWNKISVEINKLPEKEAIEKLENLLMPFDFALKIKQESNSTK